MTLAEASGPDALRSAAANLRATCDACHTLHVRPYVPSQVSEEDTNFDFDSLFDD